MYWVLHTVWIGLPCEQESFTCTMTTKMPTITAAGFIIVAKTKLHWSWGLSEHSYSLKLALRVNWYGLNVTIVKCYTAFELACGPPCLHSTKAAWQQHAQWTMQEWNSWSEIGWGFTVIYDPGKSVPWVTCSILLAYIGGTGVLETAQHIMMSYLKV